MGYRKPAKVSNIGIATVYRTLEKLTVSVLYKTMFEGGRYRYELSIEMSTSIIILFVCPCGSITEVEDDLLHILKTSWKRKVFGGRS